MYMNAIIMLLFMESVDFESNVIVIYVNIYIYI